MRKLLWALAGLIVVVLGLLGGVLAFDTPARLPPLASLSGPFANVDFGDLPSVQTYAARDRVKVGSRQRTWCNAETLRRALMRDIHGRASGPVGELLSAGCREGAMAAGARQRTWCGYGRQ
jgi:hypothetical protein